MRFIRPRRLMQRQGRSHQTQRSHQIHEPRARSDLTRVSTRRAHWRRSERCATMSSTRRSPSTGAASCVRWATAYWSSSHVVDPVRCAIAIQRAMPEQGADTPADRLLRFRFAINMGDVVSDGDLIYGDGVAIASRMEGIGRTGRDQCQPRGARPGSRSPADHVRGLWRARGSGTSAVRCGSFASCCKNDRPARRALAAEEPPRQSAGRRSPCCRFKTSAVMPSPSSFSTAWPRT